MRVRELLLSGLGVGLVLAGAGVTVFWMQEHRDASQESAERVRAADIATLKAEIERLKSDRTRSKQLSARTNYEPSSLRSQLTQLAQKQDSIGQDIDEITLAALEGSKGVSKDEEAAASELRPEDELEREAAKTQAQIEFLDQSLFTENTDPEWVDSAQRALDEAFRNEKMSGLTLVSNECRTTMCRLELHLDGSMPPAQAIHNLAQYSQWRGAGFVWIDNEGSAVVYLAKEGHSLPQSQ